MSNSKSPKTLSKSRFKLALECPAKLYYYGKPKEYTNQKQENAFLAALAEGGFQVGELAKYYNPCCKNMPACGHEIKSTGYHESIEETSKYINMEKVILYEPVIHFENFLIRIDIFIKNGKKIDLIEVKAKSFNRKQGSFRNRKGQGDYIASQWRPYLYDVAFQTWVTKHAFPDCEIEPYLMLTDKTALSTVQGLNQLFRIKKNDKGRKDIEVMKKITPEVLGEDILVKIPVKEYVEMIWAGNDIDPLKKKTEDLKSFSERIRKYADYYVDNKKYPVKTGLKCKKCEFKNSSSSADVKFKSGFEECWRAEYGEHYDFNEPHIFELWDFRKSQETLDKGIHFLKDLSYEDLFKKEPEPAEKGMGRIDRQWLQINKRISKVNEGEYVDEQLFSEMDDWIYPLHFIDFETSMVALPFTKGRRPYEQTAFQFSCHTLYKDNTIEHHEWLSQSQEFPNYQFILELKKVLGKDNGTIFRYSNHENTVLRQIYKQIIDDSEIELFNLNNLSKQEVLSWIDSITNWKSEDSEGKEIKYEGVRDMVDLWKCVKNYYYHPKMVGSNSIKQVLPTTLSASKFLKEKYSKPLDYGINLINYTMFQMSSEGDIMDPYKLLPPIHDDLDSDNLYLESGKIQDGGAAMTAYAKLQFTEMTDTERKNIVKAMLRYCELDTLAMVMIYEHWKYLKSNRMTLPN